MAFYYVISEVVYNLHINLAENMLLSLGRLSAREPWRKAHLKRTHHCPLAQRLFYRKTADI